MFFGQSRHNGVMENILIRFTAMNDDKGEEDTLAYVRWPFIPRKGERIYMTDLRVRMDENKPKDEQRTESVVFIVEDVSYGFCAFDSDTSKEAHRDYEVTIFCVMPPEERGWRGFEGPDTDD